MLLKFLWPIFLHSHSLSGKDPFVEQPHLMENHIRNGIYVMETQQWRHISTLAKNLIDDMMMTNPDKRINIDGVASNIWLKVSSWQ